MKLHDYHAKRAAIAAQEPRLREHCIHCRQSKLNCYCAHVKRFNPHITFVILIHPVEVRRRIATGRMSHLCLEGSHLIEGEDFSDHALVNQLIADPDNQAVLLYPGDDSINLSQLAPAERGKPFASNKKLVIFVLDGTWATARNMLRKSRNIQTLKKICFSLDTASTFRVRKQPAAGCYSTIEAIHQVIELLAPPLGFSNDIRAHDILLQIFDRMVEQQLLFIPPVVHQRRSKKI